MDILIRHPWIAALVALLLAWLARRSDSRPAILAAVLWLAYGTYEALMHYRVLCAQDCNIRIDLLAIYPLLLGVTLYGLIHALQRRKS